MFHIMQKKTHESLKYNNNLKGTSLWLGDGDKDRCEQRTQLWRNMEGSSKRNCVCGRLVCGQWSGGGGGRGRGMEAVAAGKMRERWSVQSFL